MSSSPAATARSPATSSATSPQQGHHARGLIRNPDHAADLEADGAVPVLCDLEHDDPRPHLGAADAIVFAAGAGPGSGPERKRTVDYGGAVKLIEAAEELGVRRYLIVSSMGAGDPGVGLGGDAPLPAGQARRRRGARRLEPRLDDRAPRPAHRRAGRRHRRARGVAAMARSPARTSRSCCSSASARTTRSARRSS